MPYRTLWHNWADLDLGSAGVLLVPGTRELVFGGKEGILYVVNRDAMGGLGLNSWSSLDLQDNVFSPPQGACALIHMDPRQPVCGLDPNGAWCQNVPDDQFRYPGALQKIPAGSALAIPK